MVGSACTHHCAHHGAYGNRSQKDTLPSAAQSPHLPCLSQSIAAPRSGAAYLRRPGGARLHTGVATPGSGAAVEHIRALYEEEELACRRVPEAARLALRLRQSVTALLRCLRHDRGIIQVQHLYCTPTKTNARLSEQTDSSHPPTCSPLVLIADSEAGSLRQPGKLASESFRRISPGGFASHGFPWFALIEATTAADLWLSCSLCTQRAGFNLKKIAGCLR